MNVETRQEQNETRNNIKNKYCEPACWYESTCWECEQRPVSQQLVVRQLRRLDANEICVGAAINACAEADHWRCESSPTDDGKIGYPYRAQPKDIGVWASNKGGAMAMQSHCVLPNTAISEDLHLLAPPKNR